MVSLVQRIAVIAGDIKLAHSVFALPFAVLGAVMALAGGRENGVRGAQGDPAIHVGLDDFNAGIDWRSAIVPLVLVVVAMVAARTAAMLANRLFDRSIDARNPRTKGRAIPSGRLAARDAIVAFAIACVVFVIVCALFGVLRDNWWPLMLSLPVLAWITLYGLFKRFTWACHLWLGASLAMSVPAAALAIDPSAVAEPALWWLAGAVLAWVAGFDIIYALQDIEVDRAQGLQSVPARFGWPGALLLSRVLHVASVACLVMAWRSDGRLGWPFAAAIVTAAALLLVEHLTVKRWGTTRMALTFFTLNGCVSLLLGAAGVLGLLISSARS